MSTAVLIDTDIGTSGNWVGVYGSDGGYVADDTGATPTYVTITPTNFTVYSTYRPTSDVPQPRKWSDHSTRVPSVWFGDPMTLQLAFGDSDTHRVALYYVADGNNRTQTVEIRDADNADALLDTQVFSSTGITDVTGFYNIPLYLVYDFVGNIKVKNINTVGPNAVQSAYFFDSAFPSSGMLSRGFVHFPGSARNFTEFE